MTAALNDVSRPLVRLRPHHRPEQGHRRPGRRAPVGLAGHITALIAEHESAKTPHAILESRCSRDAGKLECLMQAREYQAQGKQLVQPWIDSMMAAVTTRTGMALAKAAQDLSPSTWWDEFAATFGTPRP